MGELGGEDEGGLGGEDEGGLGEGVYLVRGDQRGVS